MKKVYLTIDDAPTPDFPGKIKYLHEHGIHALIFCEGRYIKKNTDALCDAIGLGFVIGNHAFDHPFFSEISIAESKKQISMTEELIEDAYDRAGTKRRCRYFRFPYFDDCRIKDYDKYAELQEYLRKSGYTRPAFEGIKTDYFKDPGLKENIDVRCTFNQSEYMLGEPDAPFGLSTEEAILARIDEDYPYEGRALNREDTTDIILLHDHEKTTKLFYRIITRYIEKGIHFLQIPCE